MTKTASALASAPKRSTLPFNHCPMHHSKPISMARRNSRRPSSSPDSRTSPAQDRCLRRSRRGEWYAASRHQPPDRSERRTPCERSGRFRRCTTTAARTGNRSPGCFGSKQREGLACRPGGPETRFRTGSRFGSDVSFSPSRQRCEG